MKQGIRERTQENKKSFVVSVLPVLHAQWSEAPGPVGTQAPKSLLSLDEESTATQCSGWGRGRWETKREQASASWGL